MPSFRSRFAVPVLALAFAAPVLAQTMSGQVKAAFDAAYGHMQKGRVARAIAKYEEALKLAPNSRDVLLEYVVALRKGSRFQQSVKAGWRLLEVDPGYVPSWGNVGNTFLAAGAWDAAGFVFDKAANLTKDKAWGAQNLLNLGFAQCGAGDVKGGMKVFQRAGKVDPKNLLVAIDLAGAQAMLGEKDQALATLKTTIAQLGKQSDARSKTAKPYAEAMVATIEQGKPVFPAESATYTQTLPAEFLKQPEKGKAAALQTTAEVEHQVRGIGDAVFTLRTPEPWALAIEGKGSAEESKSMLTLTLTPPAAVPADLMISLFGKAQEKSKVRAFVDRMGHVLLVTAVEKDVEVKELTGTNVWGYWYSLQDKTRLGQEPEEGKYAFMTQGVVVLGEMMFTFTMLTQDVEEKTLAPMFAVVQSMAVKEPGSPKGGS